MGAEGFFGSNASFGIVKEYHTYVSQCIELKNIGLSSYSRNGLEKFGMERKNGQNRLNKDISEYFGGSVPKIDLLGDTISALSIEEFDIINGRYSEVTGIDIFKVPELEIQEGESTIIVPAGNSASTLKEFQEKFDKVQKNFTTGLSPNDIRRINYTWSKILNSRYGHIKFNASFRVFNSDASCEIQLYFQGRGKSTDRKVAQRGPAMIVDIPRDVTGQAWGWGATKSAELGARVLPSEGGVDNPDNTRAAPLDIAYDEGTGKFSAGTFQTLAVLDEPLDGVPQKPIPTDPNNIPGSEFLNGPLKIGYTSAKATRFNTHNGNPNLFGPNQVGCGTNAKQKITVINRSPRKFAKGELVLCSRIDGLWVVQGFGVPETVPKAFNIEWSQIQKYIVTAPYFLRDHTGTKILPTDYVKSYRSKFYLTLNNDQTIPAFNDKRKLTILNVDSNATVSYTDSIVTVNGNILGDTSMQINWPRKPNPGYLTVYDADQLHTSVGGNNTNRTFMQNGNIDKLLNTPFLYRTPQIGFASTQLLETKPDEYGQWDASNSAGCWGLYFKDGYGSANVSRLKAYNGTYISNAAYNIYPVAGTYSLEGMGGNLTTGDVQDGDSAYNKFGINVSDNNFFHLPAQIALNGSGNITLDLNSFYPNSKSVNTPVSVNQAKFYFNNKFIQGDWLGIGSGDPFRAKDLYGLKPVNGRAVQFSPLQFEIALADFFMPPNAVYQEGSSPRYWAQNGWFDVYLNLNTTAALFNLDRSDGVNGEKIFGEMWTREGRQSRQSFTQDDVNGTFSSKIGVGKKLYNINGAPPATVPGDVNPPFGGPNIIPDYKSSKERSNVVGIIGAKATIDMPDGGLVSLSTISNYGLQNYDLKHSAGGGLAATIIGGLISFFQNLGGQDSSVKITQWGTDTDDRIDSFGTTALWCRVCDHCPNTVYDARYFSAFQFNKNDNTVDFEIPSGYIRRSDRARISLSNGEGVPSGVKIISQTNTVRRGMLLSQGGFKYLYRAIGASETSLQISQSGAGYSVGNIVKFGVDSGTSSAAEFKVTQVGGSNSGIVTVQMVTDDNNNPKYGSLPFNSFENGPMIGSLSAGDSDVIGTGAYIILKGGFIYERVLTDEEPKSYGDVLLSYPSNKGDGPGGGVVENLEKTTNFNLNKNSTGKYDVFFFFVNDILHTYTMYAPQFSYRAFANTNYVKLTINSA
jgi:hypothetical protein